MQSTKRRLAGRLLAALTVTAATAAISIAAASSAQADPAVPETVMRYALQADGMDLTTGDDEAVYRTGPMQGTLKLGDASRSSQFDEYGALVSIGTAPQEADDLGDVQIRGTGNARVEQVSLFPTRWRLVLELDLKITITNDTGSATYRSTEPMRITASIGSLDPEQFTLKARNDVRFEVVDTAAKAPHPIDMVGPVFAVPAEGVSIAGSALD